MNHEKRAVKMLSVATKQLASIETYACVVICQERVGGVLRAPERIQSLFRAPGSVYLRWLDGPAAGLQTSYVPERDGEGKFMARAPGFMGMLGAMTLDCDSPLLSAMDPHHFHTFETSIHFMVRLLNRMMAMGQEEGTIRVMQADEVDDEWLGGRATRFDAELSTGSQEAPCWPRVTLYFDHASGLPLHLRLQEGDGQLFGEYAFAEFAPNVEVPPGAFELPKL